MRDLRHFFIAVVLALPTIATAAKPAEVTRHYADLAHAVYEDSLIQAARLEHAVQNLIDNPSQVTLNAARAAWVEARAPYQQSEVYRFGNPIVDAWEGKVNAWPLDEGLIDYVDDSYGDVSDVNDFFRANIIANPTLQAGGGTIDAKVISEDFLAETLHEIGDVEANVATGYHAIEFLLWGQDLNGTGLGAGNRSYTDFDTENCTGGNCDRRAAYLHAAAELLVSDLKWITAQWAEGGDARKAVTDDPKQGVAMMLTGMGSLSYGELAGERMKLGLMLHDPEEEHDCFSDNTHNSHYYDALGIQNIYLGGYRRIDGSLLRGPSLSELVRATDAELDDSLREHLRTTVDAMTVLKRRAETIESYDQMLAAGNDEGNAVVQDAIDALVAQTRPLERVVAALSLGGIEFEGSDSLDAPGKVFQ